MPEDAYARYRAHLLDLYSVPSAGSGDGARADPLRSLEDHFLNVASPSSARAALRRYTAEPHPAGTKASFDFAVRLLREWGTMLGADLPPTDDVSSRVFQAGTRASRDEMTRGCSSDGDSKARVWIDTYETLVTDPVRASMTLARQGEKEPYWTADLNEAVLAEDPTSPQGAPPYHAFSASGSVSGQLVFANQGSREDFNRLATLGVDVRGAIVLVRYGRTFRGLKVYEAYRAGAIGVLIYSDPSEDGDCVVQKGYKPYPDGPARHPTAIQRGSVRSSGCPGDPTTPGWPSYPGPNTTRVPIEEADLPRIPSLPISYANAAKLFQALDGHGPNATQAGRGWNGSIPDVKEYFLGPSKDILFMENIVEYNLKPMYNVYACVPGHVANETVFIGNHRDAWSFGAADPGSGTATMHEIVKSIGAVVNPATAPSGKAFRPLRQIMIASWDGEEFGLAGSTEFGEDFSDWLQENVAVYHNLDIAVQGGWLSLGAVPSLIDVFQRSAQLLPDLRNKKDGTAHPSDVDKEPLAQDRSLEIRRTSPLGSGSDYTVFLMHNGISSSMAAYRRRRDDPSYMYHSNFDSMHWMETYGDPHFRRHESMAKLVGLVALRSASELALPIRTDHYATELGRYLVQVDRALGEARNTRLGDGLVASLGRVRRAVERLKGVTGVLERVRREASEAVFAPSHPNISSDVTSATSDSLTKLRVLNALVARFERGFLARSPSSTASSQADAKKGAKDAGPGLPQRPWFRHLIIAPGRQSGYGATPFPGLMEAITLDIDANANASVRNETLAVEEAARIVESLEALAVALEKGLRSVGVDLQGATAHSGPAAEGTAEEGKKGSYKARV
ncbi:Vacuolar protein sorting-associated protein 70 [Tilletia horrida]|nr:Vacuolar protein sorting-associated protein 70 [Tilletia horrida]